MKYIKKYENMIEDDHKEPEVGDYVICQDTASIGKMNVYFSTKPKFIDYLSNNIGQIVKILTKKYDEDDNEILVKYDNIPTNILSYGFMMIDNLKKDVEIETIPDLKILDELYTNITSFEFNEIIYFSNNKSDVETYIQANKYNL